MHVHIPSRVEGRFFEDVCPPAGQLKSSNAFVLVAAGATSLLASTSCANMYAGACMSAHGAARP